MTMTTMAKGLAGVGRIEQIGFVPRDFDAAIRYWTQIMGAGPFFLLEHIELGPTTYRGTRADADISAAYGYWGDIQIELVQQHCMTPSIYLDWLAEGRDGVQHLGVMVDDYAAAYAHLAAAGGVSVQETSIPGAAVATYFEMPQERTPLVEILDIAAPFRDIWADWRRIAGSWDGLTDPVRKP